MTNESKLKPFDATDLWPRSRCDSKKELHYSFALPRWIAMIDAAPEYRP